PNTDFPSDYILMQNYPNPFLSAAKSRSGDNVGTTIRFEIPPSLANAPARLAIYNVRGELVRELLNRQLPAGNHVARWDGRNDTDFEVASGIYFCRLQVGNAAGIRKLSLIK
ncbi:MAG: FlgD immunoglobulin-like domain containing protein, partial [bacterium]